jgi:hypothetical protein
MKGFLAKVRDITISGILALLPLYVFLIVLTKIWKSLNSIGAGLAQMLGIRSGVGTQARSAPTAHPEGQTTAQPCCARVHQSYGASPFPS